MKKALLVLSLLFSQILIIASFSSTVNAQATEIIFTEARCTRIGQCVDNKTCVVKERITRADGVIVEHVGLSDDPGEGGVACGSSSIGGVAVPDSVRMFNLRARVDGNQSNSNSIGIVVFASNLLKLFAIIAGIWAMLNFVLAGYTLISSSSDTGAMQKVREQITMSAIGLALIAGAYIIAGLIGLFLFGDAGFILNPKLQGAI